MELQGVIVGIQTQTPMGFEVVRTVPRLTAGFKSEELEYPVLWAFADIGGLRSAELGMCEPTRFTTNSWFRSGV